MADQGRRQISTVFSHHFFSKSGVLINLLSLDPVFKVKKN